MLKIKNLTKGFGRGNVLDGLDLTVEDGSIFGLVGVNGAGKSTLLRLIAGVYRPEGGHILLDGRSTWSDMNTKRKIAFVSDETYYPPAATIRSMCLLYEDMYDFDPDMYKKALDLFELDPGQQISSFSKGMKRKTALLFAICTHPRLMLLDEAYDGLEPLSRFRFKGILTDLIEDEDMSVIISSHNLKELEDICDSFGLLKDGKISDSGDLALSKEQVNKYQLAFNEEKDRSAFRGLDVLHYEKEGQVYRLIIRGGRLDVETTLRKMHPILMNVLPVDFEELFIYEVESGGKEHE